MKIDHHRSLLDTSNCQTYTEVIVTNKEKPYAIGARMRINRDKVAEASRFSGRQPATGFSTPTPT